MTPPRCLRRSSSARTAPASRARIAGTLPSSACAGSIGASGLATAIDAILPACSRLNAGSPSARWKRRTYRSSTTSSAMSVTSSTNTASRSTSPATPSPLSTSWQKPWVVAIVAASKSDTARASRSQRVASVSAREVAHQPLAHPLAQLAGRHPRERDEQEPLQRRALGDVARRERRDRPRLAGARARLQHGHAGRQRSGDVELAGHRCSCLRTGSHSRRAQRPTRRVSSMSHASSVRAAGSIRSAKLSGPRTSWCSGSASSPGKRADSQAPAASPPARVRGRRQAVQRRRLAHPAVVEIEQLDQVVARERGVDAARREPPPRPSWPRPTVTASNSRLGYAACTASSRTQAAIRCARVHLRVRHGAQRVVDDVRHRPAQPAAVGQRHPHVERRRARPPARARRSRRPPGRSA